MYNTIYNQLNPLQTSDGIIALTPSLLVMSSNHVIRWMIGAEPKPGRPFPLEKLFHEPELTRIKESINSCLETGQGVAHYHIQIFCDAGISPLCDYSIHPIFNQVQSIIGVILSFHRNSMISPGKHEKTNRYAMRHSAPDKETLIERLPEAVFTITTHWRISSFNHMAESITGFKREEAIGRYCWEVFRSDNCKQSCPLRTALDSGQTIMDQEVRILDKNGFRQAILVNTKVLRDDSGLVLGAVETFRPITGEMHPPDGVDFQHSFADIVGKSEQMQRLFAMIPDIAASEANVLLYGESGTGKDLFARAIHKLSLRSKGPFVAANCSAFAETLLESELFGYEKAAFTGAEKMKPGRFELAKGGTILLDEIGDLKPELQVKLLRVIENREYERVGGTKPLPMEARIISATNKNLVEAIRKQAFREDFYYRLRTVPITIPPLRERKEDIPLLVSHFIKKFNRKYHKNVRSVDLKVMKFFQKYHFPGNVRELERAIEHAYVFVKGPVIFMSNLPAWDEFSVSETGPVNPLSYKAGNKSKESVLLALSQCGGKKKEAAAMLQISRTSLWRLIKQFGLE